jgi:hypothetical protein
VKLKKLFPAISLFLVACGGGAPPFAWSPKIYVADSRTQSIVREDANGIIEQIKTSDVAFDEMICINKDEPRKALSAYQEIVKKCKQWEK